MQGRTRSKFAVAAGALAATCLIGTPAAIASSATTKPQPPTVVAHISSKAIRLSVGKQMRAGRVIFDVRTKHGDHAMQILRLHRGYTPAQASSDINKAFSGNVKAVRRVDHNITFLGGAETRPNKPGQVAIDLGAGNYMVVDQDSQAGTALKVTGTAPARAMVPASSQITLFTYGFGTEPTTIPASGWTRVNDQSDQPHFLVFNHVKANTTNKMVRRYIASGSQKPPAFGLDGGTSAGVISPGKTQVFHYDLPAGKYLIACFWPDDDTGMPHFNMGMWKLIELK